MEKAPENITAAYKEIEVLGAVTDHSSEAKKVTFKMAALIKSILNRAKVTGKVTFFHELDNTLYSAIYCQPYQRREPENQYSIDFEQCEGWGWGGGA